MNVELAIKIFAGVPVLGFFDQTNMSGDTFSYYQFIFNTAEEEAEYLTLAEVFPYLQRSAALIAELKKKSKDSNPNCQAKLTQINDAFTADLLDKNETLDNLGYNLPSNYSLCTLGPSFADSNTDYHDLEGIFYYNDHESASFFTKDINNKFGGLQK